jgi:hypothetical protein
MEDVLCWRNVTSVTMMQVSMMNVRCQLPDFQRLEIKKDDQSVCKLPLLSDKK